jgi:membrane protease YdiL (CAAX protease family)
MSDQFVKRAQEFNKFIPHAVRILYGGFTEEILLRWGMMSFLVWLLAAIFERGRENDSPPRSIFFVLAILISALLFGLGHLPVASMLAGGLTLPIFLYVLVGNSIFGVVAGLLYWRRGMEAAILAHISAHLVLISAIYLALRPRTIRNRRPPPA